MTSRAQALDEVRYGPRVVRARTPGLLLALLPWASVACGPARPRDLAVPWPDTRTDASASGARIVYSPESVAPATAELALEGAARLVACGPQRWEVRGDAVEVSNELLPEPAIAISRLADGGFRFLSSGGTLYETASALGPVVRVLAAVEGAARASVAGARVAVTTGDGRLLVSGDGRSYTAKRLDRKALDVALTDGGFGVALTVPEQVYRTDDGGETWRPWDVQRIGARALSLLAGGQVTANGASSWATLEPTRPPSIERVPPSAPPIELSAVPRSLLPARRIEPGRAFSLGGEAFAAEPPAVRGDPWALVHGGVGLPARKEELAGSERCLELALTGDADHVTAACARGGRGGMMDVLLVRWSRTNEPPEEHASRFRVRPGAVRIFADGAGRLVLVGACLPGPNPCAPGTLLRLTGWTARERRSAEGGADRDEAPAPLASASSAPEDPAASRGVETLHLFDLAGPPDAVVVSGDRLFAVGRRQKTGRDTLYTVGPDGDVTDGELEIAPGRGPRRASMSATVDGGVTVAFDGSAAAIVTADARGRVVATNAVPSATAATVVGLAGRRALVVEGQTLRETLDAGATFSPAGVVIGLATKGPVAVSCLAEGCFLGSEFARVGWGGEGPRRPPTDRPMVHELRPDELRPLTGVTCTLSRDAWVKLPEGAAVPTAASADIGKHAWARFAPHEPTASATMIHGTRAGKIELVPLLPPSKTPTAYAMASASQLEGGIVVRARIVARATGGQRLLELADVEIAWENVVTDKLVRAKLPHLGGAPLDAQDSTFGTSVPWKLPVLSVVSTGALVRAEPVSGADRAGRGGDGLVPLFSVDEKGRVTKPDFKEFPPFGFVGDWVSLGGRPFVWSVDDGLLQGTSGGATDVMALSVPGSPLSTYGIGQTYRGTVPLLEVDGAENMLGVRWPSYAFPFEPSGFGAAEALAGQRDHLAAKRRICTPDDRRRTTRVVTAPEVGTRRALAIRSPEGAQLARLRSNRRVLYGTKADPCEAAEDAEPIDTDAGSATLAALYFPGDPEHGWAFRISDTRVEARTMTCREDATVTLPLGD